MDTAKLIVVLLLGFAVVTGLAVAIVPSAALYVVAWAATVTFLGLEWLRRGMVRG